MSTDWKKEFEAMGISLPLAPQSQSERNSALEKIGRSLNWINESRRTDSTLVEPTLYQNEKFSEAMDALENNLGSIGDYLFKGLS